MIEYDETCPRCGSNDPWAIIETSPIWPSKTEYEIILICKNQTIDEETKAVIDTCNYRIVKFIDKSPEYEPEEN